MRILVTGAAGFIGFHLCHRLLTDGAEVYGLDNFNDYYDPGLKEARVRQLMQTAKTSASTFHLVRADIRDLDALRKAFDSTGPNVVVNLAAQAGVRYSVENPSLYLETNVVGFHNVLENCRRHRVEHLVYASSSSVYGYSNSERFSEAEPTDHPLNIYSATKKANELIAYAYSDLYQIPATGVRLFTVYGPWGRPDMALFSFTKAMLEGRPIQLYNFGQVVRDFTYIDDVTESIVRILARPPELGIANNGDTRSPFRGNSAPHHVLNVGNGCPSPVLEFVQALEAALGIEAVKEMLPMQPGDVPITAADTSQLFAWTGFTPRTPIRDGVARFVDWYLQHYR